MERIKENFINELDRIMEENFGEQKEHTKIFGGVPVLNKKYVAYTYKKMPINRSERERKRRAIEYVENFKSILRDEDVDFAYSIKAFWALSEMLERANIRLQDYLNILMWFVEYNANRGHLNENSIFLDITLVENVALDTLTNEELIQLIGSGEITEFLYDEEKDRTELEQAQREEILDKIDLLDCHCEKELESLRTLYTYLPMSDSITEEDKDTILEAFKTLDVSESVLAKVKIVLEKRISKGSKQVPSEIKKEDYIKAEKKYLTNKEYKLIRKRISLIYDLRTGALMKQDLTYDEMMDCLADLYIIGEEEAQMLRFLSMCKSVVAFEENIAEKYRLLRDEFIKRLGIGYVLPLDAYLEMIDCDFNREENENCLKREMEKLLTFIPNHFVYEIEVIKKRIKKEGKTL